MLLRKLFAFELIVALLFSATNHPINSASAISKMPTNPTLESAQKSLQTQAEFFTENKGQWDPAILFIGKTPFGKVAFAKDAIYYQMIQSEKTTQSQTIQLSFVNPLAPVVSGAETLSHYNNYFIGSDRSKWASNCRNFAKVTYQDVWAGIDLAYFFTPEGMKYEYYVSPEADMKNLQILVEGADLTNHGKTLQLTNKLGSIQDANLKVFDQATGQIISSTFLIENNVLSFQGIPEKRTNTITIDPLVYSTFVGGTRNDYGYGIAVDAVGNAYITGNSYSSDFPTTIGAYDTTYNGSDFFVTKLAPDGMSLVYSTYVGGTGDEYANGIAIDAVGNTYITGDTTSSDFPTTIGAYDSTYNGDYDCFVTKLAPNGSSLVYSTFIGGVWSEYAYKIAVDSVGNAYITGNTYSSDFPTTFGTYDTTHNGSEDCFVTKLAPNGSSLVYSTFVGGTGDDYGYGIAVDSTGNAFITGYTWSSDFPTTIGAYDTTHNGDYDCFVTKVAPDGMSLVYSTFVGGTWSEYGYGITVDAVGNTYITGDTTNSDFPTTIGAYDTTYNGDNDCFVTKLAPNGSSLVYSTFIGGIWSDHSFGITVDAVGNTYITGNTSNSDFPTTINAYDTTYNGANDCFVTKVAPNGMSLEYSTFVGGTGDDYAYGIAVDAVGNAYFTGYTSNSDFPTTINAYDTSYNGGNECYVTKLGTISVEATLSGNLTYNLANLSWSVTNHNNTEIKGYEIYRADIVDNVFQLIGTVDGANNQSYMDSTGVIGKTYSYYINVLNNNSMKIAQSNTITLGPIRAFPLPILALSIWTNKGEFCTGEDVLYKVTLFNQSAGSATDITMGVTFPREIQFLSADKYQGSIQPSGLVTFYLGTIPGNSSVTFQINASVAGSVPFEKSTATFFEVACKENSTDQKVINLVLKKCGGGSPILDILVRYKNVSYDTATGEIYLLQSEELTMDVEFSGFNTPLSYEIGWGDGTVDKMVKQSETKYVLKHQFTSKGKMVIKIMGTDASGRTKSVSLNLNVK